MSKPSNDSLRRIAVIGGSRIPFCRSNSIYADKTNLDMLAAALQGLVDRFGLDGQQLDEVVAGAVTSHSKDWNLAREALAVDLAVATDPGHHAAAGLRHQPAGGADDRGQDRHGPDRMRHRRRQRHDFGPTHQFRPQILAAPGQGRGRPQRQAAPSGVQGISPG